MERDKQLLTVEENKLWQQWVNLHPQTIALRYVDGELNWQQLSCVVAFYADAFQQQGVKNGDVIALVGRNQLELVLGYLACLQLKVVCSIIADQPYLTLIQKLQTLVPASRLTRQQPASCFISFIQPSAYQADASHQTLSQLEQLARPLSIEPFTQDLFKQAMLFRNKSSLDLLTIQSDPQALASIIFTSGSSGYAKAVAHQISHHMLSAKGLINVFNFHTNDSWLLSLPLYHVSGLAILWRWLVTGAQLVVSCGELNRDLFNVTHASLVAVQLQRFIAAYHLSSSKELTLKRVLLGGSHIPTSLCHQAAELGIETWVGYGMTETASTVVIKCMGGNGTISNKSLLLPYRSMKIEDKRIYMGDSRHGGKTLASGYYQQGNIVPLCDENGWFDTKDLGCYESDDFRVIGRVDNQFISGGENIHCEEIESVLMRDPEITQAFIVPVEDVQFGARGVAVLIYANDGTTKTAVTEIEKAQFEALLSVHIPKFKWPIDYFICTHVSISNPLNASGIKISRSEIKKWFSQCLEHNYQLCS